MRTLGERRARSVKLEQKLPHETGVLTRAYLGVADYDLSLGSLLRRAS